MTDHGGIRKESGKKKRFFRPKFGLKVVLGLTTILCVFLGSLFPFIQRQRVEQKAIDDLNELYYSTPGIQPEVAFDYQFGPKSLAEAKQPEPKGPKFVRSILGEHVFSTVKSIKLRGGPYAKVKTFEDVAPLLKKFKNLEEVDAYGLGFRKEADFFAAWPQMKSLSLSNWEELEDVSGLRELKKLESLNLSRTGVRSIAPVSSCSQMEKLSLSGCRDLVDVEVVGGLKQLKHLEQSFCSRIKSLEYLANFRHLEYLSCSFSEHVTTFDFALIASNSKLQSLTLRGFDSFENIEMLGQFRKLQYLVIDSCDGCKGLPSLTELADLKSVVLNDCPITDLSGVGDAPGVQVLVLDRCHKLRSINVLADMKKLRTLTVHCDGVEDMQPLSRLESLDEISLSGPAIKSLGTLPCKTLLRINVSNCPNLTDVSSLASCPPGAFVILANCTQVTQDSIDLVQDETGVRVVIHSY